MIGWSVYFKERSDIMQRTTRHIWNQNGKYIGMFVDDNVNPPFDYTQLDPCCGACQIEINGKWYTLENNYDCNRPK
jgi:hypothetical protein